MDTQRMISCLESMHPGAECELVFSSPFELLVAVILSAQCTDKRVNSVTKELFKVANTPEAFAAMDIAFLENAIHSCGFYHSKAKNIKAAAEAIVSRFGGVVPSSMEELTSLPGVGRKTANVMIAVAFGGNAFAVDTHVFRLSHRLGLSNANTPEEVEKDLCAAFPVSSWAKVHHLLIHHGRDLCRARNPECERCLLSDICVYFGQNKERAAYSPLE